MIPNMIPVIEEQLKEKDKEIERLNNIINKLEKWLITQENYNEKVNSIIYSARGFEDKQILNKLQELKEDNKDLVKENDNE